LERSMIKKNKLHLILSADIEYSIADTMLVALSNFAFVKMNPRFGKCRSFNNNPIIFTWNALGYLNLLDGHHRTIFFDGKWLKVVSWFALEKRIMKFAD